MILIAESGSTKTKWYQLDDLRVLETETIGLNPNSTGEREFKVVLRTKVKPSLKGQPRKIFFYGAGCGSSKNKNRVRTFLATVFPEAKTEVQTDLLGAARGLLGSRKGIIGILGTGSNAGRYNGKVITVSPPSLGYILGDEGSGTWIGKKLIQSYFSGEMPSSLSRKFKDQRAKELSKLQIELYRNSAPAAFLGSFAPFASENKKHVFIKKLLQEGFRLYRDRFLMQLKPAKNATIVFTGSVAWEFKEILAPVIQEKFPVDIRFWKEPGEGLVLYHWAQSSNKR